MTDPVTHPVAAVASIMASPENGRQTDGIRNRLLTTAKVEDLLMQTITEIPHKADLDLRRIRITETRAIKAETSILTIGCHSKADLHPVTITTVVLVLSIAITQMGQVITILWVQAIVITLPATTLRMVLNHHSHPQNRKMTQNSRFPCYPHRPQAAFHSHLMPMIPERQQVKTQAILLKLSSRRKRKVDGM